MAFDNTGEVYSAMSTLFVDMVNKVYTGMFEGEDAKNAYLQLIFATEIYAQRYLYSTLNAESGKTWLEDFTERMNSVTAAFGTMSDADKTLFNTELGALYATYMGLLEDYTAEGEDPEVDLGDWADDFAEFEDAVLKLELAYAILGEGANYYDMFFSAYERVQTIANKILTDPSVPANVKEAFVYNEMYSTSSLDKILDPDFVIDPEKEVFWTYDYVLSVYRSMYVNALITLDGGGGLYDYYQLYGFQNFMNKSYDVIWAYMGAEKDAVDIFEKDKVLDVMKDFCNMDANAQMMFILYIEGENGLYYTAISEFLKEEFTENVAAAGELFIALEMEAILYNYYSFMVEIDGATEEELADAAESLIDAHTELETALSGLSEDERKEFNDAFAEMLAVYEAIVESAVSTPAE
jgi:hypothetical protein